MLGIHPNEIPYLTEIDNVDQLKSITLKNLEKIYFIGLYDECSGRIFICPGFEEVYIKRDRIEFLVCRIYFAAQQRLLKLICLILIIK